MRRFSLVLLAAALFPGSRFGLAEENGAKSLGQPARLVYPNGLAAYDGGLLIADIGSHALLRLDADGGLTAIAGTGKPGFSGDGGPAAEARLNAPFDVLTLDGSGGILIADTYNHRIRRIDRSGIITTIAGNGKSQYAGDGGPAVEASLQLPQGIAVDRHGNLFIADTFNHVIRRVDAAGTIATFAGSEPGLAGDGRPATNAQLNLPMAVAIDSQDRVHFCDGSNSRIRRVNADGTIETVAGFGQGAALGGAGFEGDDGPPARAKLFTPADLEFGPAGHLYISDSGNNRIRLIRDDTITTIAGTGNADFSGDGGPASEATLRAPQKIALQPDGTVYIADRTNRRIRVIELDGKIKTLIDGGEPETAIRIGTN